jgi:guanine deaminase
MQYSSQAEPPHRFLIEGGRVLDPDSSDAPPADVVVEGDTIVDIVSPGTVAAADLSRMAAHDRLLIPGLVNAHTHAHGALGRGLVPDCVNLEMFLARAGAINGGRTLDDKRLSAELSAVEMLRKGCTACFDLFVEYPLPTTEGVWAVAEAYENAGMRAVVAPMMADRTLYQAVPGLGASLSPHLRETTGAMVLPHHEAAIAACVAILDGWPCDTERVRPGIAPTIPLHCSDDFLAACGRLGREYGVSVQTHLGETRLQALSGPRRYGRSLTAHLSCLGLIDQRFSAAHGIWLDDDDIAILADAGASVAHNPMSNMRIGSGAAPVRRLRAAGINVGIGTDASNTSDGQNMFEATRLAAYLSRLQTPDYNAWLSAAEAFAMATQASARILGFDRIGRIERGYKADLVFLDLSEPHFIPLRNPLLQTVFAEAGASIRTVIVGGRVVVEDGRVLTVDEHTLRRRAEAAARRLDAQNAAAMAVASKGSCEVGAYCLAQYGVTQSL